MSLRWDFPDPSDLEEAKQRQRVTAAMDRWWDAFLANRENLRAAFRGTNESFDVPGFTNEHLEPIAEGLCWEYGPGVTKGGDRLVITPESNHQLRPLVRELLRRAPQLPDWEFHPGRLPEDPQTAFHVAEQIARFGARDVKVQVSLGDYRRVDLKFHVANAHGNETAAHNYVFRAAEQLLGEQILENWIGLIELAPRRSPLQRLFAGRPLGLVSPERLKPTVDALIAASREQLADPPPRVIAQQDPDDPRLSWGTFNLEPDERDDYPRRDDMFVIATCEAELARAEMNDRIFHSPRFSRTGEIFAYLKIDRRADAHGSIEIDSAAARGVIEEAVDAMLGEHSLGCTTGGGTGRLYAYVDVALTDIRRAIPVLRDLLQRHRLSERSWLLFFDAELADEWVGIYPHTPPPPARTEQ